MVARAFISQGQAEADRFVTGQPGLHRSSTTARGYIPCLKTEVWMGSQITHLVGSNKNPEL